MSNELVQFCGPDGTLSRRPSRLAGATHQGHVRTRNEDAIGLFNFKGIDITLLGDGLGGIPLGQEASRLAVHAAGTYVITRLRVHKFLRGRSINLQHIAMGALIRAQEVLEAEGSRRGIQRRDQGLRTTLIVLLSNQSEFAYAYAGDGLGLTLRRDERGNWDLEHWLKPAKGEASNVVTCCLGPTLEGVPLGGGGRLAPGDIQLVSTDGLSDKVDIQKFAPYLVEQLRQASGDPQRVLEEMLEFLAGEREGAHYLFDDNFSVAAVSCG